MKKYQGRTLADTTHGRIISPRTRNNRKICKTWQNKYVKLRALRRYSKS